MRITDEEMILSFLAGEGADHLGRFYIDTLDWSDIQLEACHDQIQWIFPLHEDSKMARVYPVLSPEIVEKAKNDPVILNNLIDAKTRFERFYGIGTYDDRMKQDRWCRDKNHNLLRITRIIRCLRLFGLEKEAKDFYDKVIVVANRCGINKNTYTYWNMALNDKVWDSLQA